MIDDLPQRLASHQPEPATGTIPNVDRWVAASGLQKSIRRNNVKEALSCTRLLLDVDPQRFWRRIVVCAMEDVGVGDLDAVVDTIFVARSKTWRDQHGGDLHAASFVVTNLCGAVKNRCTDDLGLVALFHPNYRESRAELACATEAALCDVVADTSQPLTRRSLAAMFLAGTNAWAAPELPRRRGDLGVLLDVFRHIGLPEFICEAIKGGAAKEKGALPCNLGLIWLLDAASPTRDIRDERTGLTHLGMINGLSSEAYDMHTRTGKRALADFCRACKPMREYVSRFVPEREIYWVLDGLAWHAESSLLDRRLVFEGSEEVFEKAKEANIAAGEFPVERVDEAIDLMRKHLPDLHQARLRVVESQNER